MIILPILLAGFLRIYKIFSNYYFTGELGKELLFANQIISEGSIPLVGMGTSHEWLTYGPIYYWILVPVIKIFGSSPFVLYWISLAVSLLGIFVTYLVFKKIVGKRFALIVSFFVAVSPLYIWATRLSKLHTFFFILTPAIIYFLYKVWNGGRWAIFWLGVSYGALFSFHFSQIPIFLVIMLTVFIKRKILKIKDYLYLLLGLLLPNVTIIIHDAKNGFSMVKNLLLWIPYRISGFLGLYPKNNMNSEVGVSTLSAFNEFLGRNIFWDSRFWILGSIFFISLLLFFVFQNRKKIGKDFLVFYVITSTAVQMFALFIHTSPPLHYFFPVFLNFALIFSYYVDRTWKRKLTKALTMLFFLSMSVANIFALNMEHLNDEDYTPLATQINAVDTILNDANGKPFSLERVGPYDYFPENYSQHFQYLILEKGGVIEPGSDLKYTIFDFGDILISRTIANE